MAVGKTTTEKNLSGKKVEKQKKITVAQAQKNPGTVDPWDAYREEFETESTPIADWGPLTPIPVFNKMNNERVIQNEKTNAMIRLGGDRGSTGTHGYGRDTGAAAIDLVVGMTGKLARVRDKNGFTVKTNPSPALDAARIYISERTNIDKNFSLSRTKTPDSFGQSGIAIKADDVRVIARNTIKLVTGPDNYGSDGKFKGDVVEGIFLIAGNADGECQPMVLGDNLVSCLLYIMKTAQKNVGLEILDIVGEIAELWGAIVQVSLNSGPIPAIPNIPNPLLIAFNIAKALELTLKSILMYNEHLEWTFIQKHYLDPSGEEYILSPANKTN